MEPPWSPPVARSTAPDATSAALPLDEPPALRVRSHGLRTGPDADVWLPPEKHRSSHTALPMIVAPASSRRVTMVASRMGTNPSTVREPFIMGTPATIVLSLIATVRPVSGPSPDPVTVVRTYQAPRGLSSSVGHSQARSGAVGAIVVYSCSTASQEPRDAWTNGANDAMSAASRPSPYRSARSASRSLSGAVMLIVMPLRVAAGVAASDGRRRYRRTFIMQPSDLSQQGSDPAAGRVLAARVDPLCRSGSTVAFVGAMGWPLTPSCQGFGGKPLTGI
jgi:hypothetical protein